MKVYMEVTEYHEGHIKATVYVNEVYIPELNTYQPESDFFHALREILRFGYPKWLERHSTVKRGEGGWA